MRRPLRRINRIARGGFSDLLNCQRESYKWMILFCGEDKAKLKRRQHLGARVGAAANCRRVKSADWFYIWDLGFERGRVFFDELSACARRRLTPATHAHTRDCVVLLFFFLFLSEPERKRAARSGKFSCEAEGPLGTDTEAHFHFETSLSAPFPLTDDSLSCVCAPACLSLALSGSLPGL